MGRLDGKRAVVLGAAGAGNMGQAIARRFAAEGARVLVAGRQEAPLRALAEAIGGEWARCDITARAEVQALADRARDAFGGVDIAVNATGRGLLKPLLDVTEAELDAIVALQFTGVHHFLACFVAAMLANDPPGGSIIQLSSATVRAPIADHAAYIGTKAGSEALIRCVANDFGARGIRANVVAPGLTASPMTAQAMATPGLADAFIARTPAGRLNTIDDIANACLWLASDEAFVTGEVLQVNGGLTLRGNPQGADVATSIGAAMARAGAS